MARRVFMHIGTPKAGTTFLQTTMWHNRSQLRAQGFLYPGSKRMDHYHATRMFRAAPRTGPTGQRADAWDRLVGELAAWPGTGLISHEFFSMASRRQARRAVVALEPAEVHVVLTARDYVRQFPAVWQEALKMNSDLSFDEFMRGALAFDLPGAWGWNTQDMPTVLDRWAGTVSPDRVHVITVPRPGAPPNVLWERWCEVLGIDDSDFDFDVVFGNESLGAPQAALLHRVKPFLSDSLRELPVCHRWVRQYFGHEVLVPQQGERFGPRPDQAAELRRLSLLAVKAIESAGYAVTGDLTELIPEEASAVQQHPDDVSEAEIVEVAARAIDQMIRDVRDLTSERNYWRREVRQVAAPPRSLGVKAVAQRVRKRLGRGR